MKNMLLNLFSQLILTCIGIFGAVYFHRWWLILVALGLVFVVYAMSAEGDKI